VKITSIADVAVFDVSDTTFVIYAPDSVSIVIPNAFTPNGDGYNDNFGPVTKGIGSLEMNINDRNGRLVHTIDSVNGRWDGNMPSGSAAPQGVYFYLLKAMGYDNLEYVRQGNVNLYRDLIDLTPNPVKSTAILDLTGRFSGDKTISIYSSSGILVRKFTTMEDVVRLDFSVLNAGLYILKATDQEQVIVVKFIKE
jgi:gliding motility-associated-like protein